MLRINENDARKTKKRSKSVAFKDEEEVINPEDVDPSVGKFRNLVHTSVIPNKRVKADFESTMFGTKPSSSSSSDAFLSMDQHATSGHSNRMNSLASSMLLGKFQIPNPAPEIDLERHAEPTPIAVVPTTLSASDFSFDTAREELQKKKKYAKEAWPGRKPPAMSM
jgi:nuclear inhibitor of protein phosphatase 1